jgi:HEAT repeat protein
MTPAEFDQLFRAKNPKVVEYAQQAGPPIVSQIEPYLRDGDYVIRLLAVNSVAAAGGTQAPQLLIHALGDSNEQVRDNAVNALHQRLPLGQERALLAAWDANQTRDGYVRQQIPMVLGRMREAPEIAQLKARLARDPRQEVKDGVIAGMAKLGEPSARMTLGEMLRDARGTRTAELIEFVKYEDEPWVIPLLVPVLQRRDIALRIPTHVVTIQRRECDLAVDEVIRISKARFSFEVESTAQYSEAQINEVLRYAQVQPR